MVLKSQTVFDTIEKMRLEKEDGFGDVVDKVKGMY